MKTQNIRILGFAGLIAATYFAAYFLSIRYDYSSGTETQVFVTPIYEPCNASIVRLAFAPAHYLDARYFRPKHWEPEPIVK